MNNDVLGRFFEENYHGFKQYLTRRYSSLNEYDVEDVIQQTLIRILSKGDSLINVRSLSSYMYSALSNNAKDYFKKYNRVEIHDQYSEHFHTPTRSVEEEFLLKELKEVIKNTLYQMDAKLRYVFIETEINGRSYLDLVNETGEKLGTLLSRKNRAKTKLQDMLYDYLEIRRN